MYYPLCFRAVTERSVCDMDVIVPVLPVYAPLNDARLQEFLRNTKITTPDSVRVIVYDFRGEPGIINLFFDGKKITVVYDYTKRNHNFDIPKIRMMEGNNIQFITTNNSAEYVLRNDGKVVESIFSYMFPRPS